jgi:cellulose synthase/poly-beta-1,6-N-acetylglucosamine synthase-like glycosyltransferase
MIQDYDLNLKVSIICANWASTPTVPACTHSFWKQNYPRDKMEVIFVDDNSPDKAELIRLMKELMRKYSDLRIRFFGTQKRKLEATLPINIAVKRAMGDIVILCDSGKASFTNQKLVAASTKLQGHVRENVRDLHKKP